MIRRAAATGMLFLVVAASAGAAQAAPRDEVYTVDNPHSILDFTVRLLGFNRTRGTFGSWSCDFAYSPTNPARDFIAFVAEVGSINTQEAERDADLVGPSFFDAKRVPMMRFQSTSITGTPASLTVDGNLTIKDSTRRVRFVAHLINPEAVDPFGNRRLAFAASLTINRRDFGVNGPAFWSRAISDSVTIEIEVGGRVWDYASLGFSRTATFGPVVAAAADSGKLESTLRRLEASLRGETDSAKLPRPQESIVAAMRIGQHGDWKSARRVLEVALDAGGARWNDGAKAAVETRLAETLLRSGDAAGARLHIARARSLDPDDTNALAWQRLINSS